MTRTEISPAVALAVRALRDALRDLLSAAPDEMRDPRGLERGARLMALAAGTGVTLDRILDGTPAVAAPIAAE